MARHSLIRLVSLSAIVASILSIPITASAQSGIASVYSGGRTANGEHANPHGMTAAHRSLPFGTLVQVTNERTGRSVVVRINDRGPHVKGRVIDLSTGAARAVGIWDGLARVQIEAFASDQPSAFPR